MPGTGQVSKHNCNLPASGMTCMTPGGMQVGGEGGREAQVSAHILSLSAVTDDDNQLVIRWGCHHHVCKLCQYLEPDFQDRCHIKGQQEAACTYSCPPLCQPDRHANAIQVKRISSARHFQTYVFLPVHEGISYSRLQTPPWGWGGGWTQGALPLQKESQFTPRTAPFPQGLHSAFKARTHTQPC